MRPTCGSQKHLHVSTPMEDPDLAQESSNPPLDFAPLHEVLAEQ